MVPINDNKYFCWYTQRCFPLFLLINFQNTLSGERQTGSNFCCISWNKRLKQAYIVSKHFYSIALPPFWMADKGGKCEYDALLNSWKAKLKSEQKVQLNPGSATTSCKQRNKGNNDRSCFGELGTDIKYREHKNSRVGCFAGRLGRKGSLCPLRISPWALQH